LLWNGDNDSVANAFSISATIRHLSETLQAHGNGMDTTEAFRTRALAMEREAANRYREYEGWFGDRHLQGLAARCRKLAVVHRERCTELVDAKDVIEGGEFEAPRHAWIDGGSAQPGAGDVFYRLAGPRQLLEVALDAELVALRFYEAASQRPADASTLAYALSLASNGMRCVGEVVAGIDEVSSVDWESVLAGGGGPALALGAERRLDRPLNV
jgi:rubrerythrin